MDKFFSHLAVDVVLDQAILHFTQESVAGELRALVWMAAMGVQLFLVRRWVLSWAGLEYQPLENKALVPSR